MEQMQSNNSLLHREMVYSVTSLFLCTVLQSVLLPDTTQQGYKQVAFLVEVFLLPDTTQQVDKQVAFLVEVFLLPDTTQQVDKQVAFLVAVFLLPDKQGQVWSSRGSPLCWC